MSKDFGTNGNCIDTWKDIRRMNLLSVQFTADTKYRLYHVERVKTVFVQICSKRFKINLNWDATTKLFHYWICSMICKFSKIRIIIVLCFLILAHWRERGGVFVFSKNTIICSNLCQRWAWSASKELSNQDTRAPFLQGSAEHSVKICKKMIPSKYTMNVFQWVLATEEIISLVKLFASFIMPLRYIYVKKIF